MLIREPINATILRQSIIIFPICIATELLFKSAPPVSTPFRNPLQILLRRCDSSSDIVSVTRSPFFPPSLSSLERVRSSYGKIESGWFSDIFVDRANLLGYFCQSCFGKATRS